MQAVKKPSQLRGERSLRRRGLLVHPSTHRITERIKLKARAIRLKEEYKLKYLSKGKPSVSHKASRCTIDLTAEEPAVELSTSERIISVVKRTVTFCIVLLVSYLIAIAICASAGYYLRYNIFLQ